MTSIQSLPLEILLEIMLYVFIGARGKPHQNFQHFSLVCKNWTPHAQRLLFRNVRLHNPRATYGFLEATVPNSQNEASARLGSFVRTLDMTLMSREMITLLPFVLRHCTKLYEFSGLFYNPMDLNTLINLPHTPQDLIKLSSTNYTELPLPQIQALRIQSSVEKFNVTQGLLQIWPDIKHLVLAGRAALGSLESQVINGTSSPTHISEVKIIGKLGASKLQPHYIGSLLHQLCSSSMGNLCMVDFGGLDDASLPELDSFFIDHGSHLRSLRLPWMSQKKRLAQLHRCINLEEIGVQGYPTIPIRQDCPTAKIIHASFATIPSQALYPLDKAFAWIKTMPNLRVLTWAGRSTANDPKVDDKMNRDQERLVALCEEMQVRLRLTFNSPPEHEELIIPSTFPRDELMTAVWR
ncbi:hypothetical protein CPB86DRAFT_814227 [Serendipita vermifera]|nr:hypothetical protein CPB86DRAFT_814227 [Serendipita vermifera]